jgi:CubicO group peptidase (beta-lactamase class C family)
MNCCPAFAVDGRASSLPDESEVAHVFRPLIEDGSYVGIAVGIVGPGEQKVFSFGKTNRSGNQRPSGDTVFPLASITKVFTGVLLADFVLRGRVHLDDPITKYLPPGVVRPDSPLARVTLLDLATHMSGLPKSPTNARGGEAGRFGRPYSVEEMYEFLSTYRPEHTPGTNFHYSNIGIALLGNILERVSGIPYGRLVQERICMPLGMTSTRIIPDASMNSRMAKGYGLRGNPVRLKRFDVGKSSGGLYSTTNDMMKFLAANMGFSNAAIVPALKFAQVPRRRVPGKANAFMGLTWHIRQVGDRQILSKNGGLAGFQSFIAFSKADGIGMIAFGNSSPKSRKLDAASRRVLRELAFQSDPEHNQ